jgi:UDP-glucuronate decarboxylase
MKLDATLAKEFKEDIADALPKDVIQSFEGKTILILGGSGFLGSLYKLFFIFCNNEKIFSNPCKIISIDNYIKGTLSINDETKDDNLENINHDLNTPLGLKLHNKKIDFIINCSGNASPQQYEKYPLETMDISSVGAKYALELALNHGAKILNFSSSEVLGTPEDKDIPTTEDCIPKIHSLNKRAPYDIGKLFIEGLNWTFKYKYNLDCKVVRPFNVIGRFHKNDYRVIPNYLNKLFNNEKIQVYKPGTQTRTFCYYTDFLVGTILVLIKGENLLYHIGNSDNEISMHELALKMEKIVGRTDLVELIETPEVYKHEPRRRCPSVEKAKQELNYQPKIQLDDALNRIYNWAKNTY